jgi:hypothetical protein
MLNESHSFDTFVVTPWDAAPQDYTQQVKTAIGLCRKYTGLTFLHYLQASGLEKQISG